MSANLSLFSSILYKLQVSNLKLFYCLVLSFVFSLLTNDIKNSIRKVKKTVFFYWQSQDLLVYYFNVHHDTCAKRFRMKNFQQLLFISS